MSGWNPASRSRWLDRLRRACFAVISQMVAVFTASELRNEKIMVVASPRTGGFKDLEQYR